MKRAGIVTRWGEIFIAMANSEVVLFLIQVNLTEYVRLAVELARLNADNTRSFFGPLAKGT